MVTIFQFSLILFICLGSLTYGYCSSIIATTLGQPSFIQYFDLATRSDGESLIGAINGLYQTGGLLGAVSVLYLPDKLGRRWAIFIGGVFCIVGGALQAGSVHIVMFLIARFLVGCGIGCLVTMTPLYQSEVSPTDIRGFLVGMHGVMICTGYTIASWIGVGPLAIQVIFPLLLCIGVFYVPESPRWYNSDAAHVEFLRIYADSTSNTANQTLEDEFLLLRAQISQDMANPVSAVQFWTDKPLRKRCILGWLTFAAGQGTATLVINNYGPMLYSRLGFNPIQQLLIQSGWISVCPFANFVNSLIIDRVGRVKLLMFGLAGSVVALIGECITVDMFQKSQSRGTAGAAVFFLFLHITLFGLSYDATSYVYGSEIFPTHVRARGLSISMTGLFVSTIIFLQSAPSAFTNVGWKYYLAFIAMSTVMFFVVWLYFPETKGKSLEDIAEVFGDNVTLNDSASASIHKQFKEKQHVEDVSA
ncbi:MFS transporter [Ilyonectria sp. MPI-CAGE-AT-0026]|nr:MFS transporter [Ilyonectria sp. MPI-CAGE-AT-0026]